MKKFRPTLNAIAVVIFTLTVTSLAQAQASRTWVSGVGDDVNPCSRTAPCKTFAGAISKTAANGEIDALDPGGFGTLTVTKSITLDGQGTLASILNSGGINGINLNDSAAAAPRTSNLTVRNLSINGAGTSAGLNGIRWISGRTLIVKNVDISNQTGNGIEASSVVVPSIGDLRARMFVTNTDFTNLTGATSAGINASATSAYFSVAVDRVHTARVPIGMKIGSNTFPTVRHSMFTNGTTGIEMVSGAAGSPVATIEDTDLSENTTGLIVGTGTTALLSQSTITVCTTGISGAGSARSSGNNRILGNSNDGNVPAITNPK
jgi:hypothetical protein